MEELNARIKAAYNSVTLTEALGSQTLEGILLSADRSGGGITVKSASKHRKIRMILAAAAAAAAMTVTAGAVIAGVSHSENVDGVLGQGAAGTVNSYGFISQTARAGDVNVSLDAFFCDGLACHAILSFEAEDPDKDFTDVFENAELAGEAMDCARHNIEDLADSSVRTDFVTFLTPEENRCVLKVTLKDGSSVDFDVDIAACTEYCVFTAEDGKEIGAGPLSLSGGFALPFDEEYEKVTLHYSDGTEKRIWSTYGESGVTYDYNGEPDIRLTFLLFGETVDIQNVRSITLGTKEFTRQ